MSILAGQNFASMEFQTKLHPTGSNQLPGFEFSPRDGYISIFAGRGGAEMGNSLCGLDQDPHVNMRSARAVKKAPLFALLAIIVCISCIWCNGFIFTHVQIYARLPKSEPHATRATGVTASDDRLKSIRSISSSFSDSTLNAN